jgi:uncharacterized protein
MDFLVYGRGAPGADDQSDDPLLDEAHWSYMDGFTDGMTARGPTLSEDRQAWTGSLHVVDLANADAAQAFARNDPYHQAGLFSGHLIWRFDNLLGRTMWDFTPRGDDVPFLVLAYGDSDGQGPGHEQTSPAPSLGSRLVVWGTLRSVPAHRPCGVALALMASDGEAARSLIADEPTMLGRSAHKEIHAWTFGGRR